MLLILQIIANIYSAFCWWKAYFHQGTFQIKKIISLFLKPPEIVFCFPFSWQIFDLVLNLDDLVKDYHARYKSWKSEKKMHL